MLPGPTGLSFQHCVRRPLLGLPAGPAPSGVSPQPLVPAPSRRHNLKEDIHRCIAARSAAGRHAARSSAGRRIPLERLWLRALPLEPGPAGPRTRIPDRAGTPAQAPRCGVQTIP